MPGQLLHVAQGNARFDHLLVKLVMKETPYKPTLRHETDLRSRSREGPVYHLPEQLCASGSSVLKPHIVGEPESE
jgi:hypothetical protein